ncbi:MAG TPA: class I SAM-dependent methyltransferase [Vicinamibacterales bacterium]|nr:class I SAM-dependent methyltransferase [Vicinamibacterales bacterium]
MTAVAADVEARARQSLGRAHRAIHATVAALLRARGARGVLADVGCGTGDLAREMGGSFESIVGIDAVRYDGLPPDVTFVRADLDAERLPLDDASVDVAVAVEVIEHLENPRAFVRELARITKPGGWVALTTPNQLSALSLLTLIVKGRFSAFQERDYPAHRTALLEIDLRRIAAECGLGEVAVAYSRRGRLPLTRFHYPAAIAAAAPRWFSDNLAMIGRRCASRS